MYVYIKNNQTSLYLAVKQRSGENLLHRLILWKSENSYRLLGFKISLTYSKQNSFFIENKIAMTLIISFQSFMTNNISLVEILIKFDRENGFSIIFQIESFKPIVGN